MEKEIKHISGSAGGFLVGRSHANNGIKAINKATGQPLEMEGGEVVITKTAVEDEELREFEGEMLTNREILSRINESGGGVSFAEGGEIPEELYFDETEYSFSGEKLPGHAIAHRISSCGCKHNNQNYTIEEIDILISKAEEETRKLVANNDFEKLQKANKLIGDLIDKRNSLSEGKTIKDIAAMHNVSVSHIENQIEKGIKVEAEHTSNPQEQVKIAMDHLVENPNYYDILAEAHLEKGGNLSNKKFEKKFNKTVIIDELKSEIIVVKQPDGFILFEINFYKQNQNKEPYYIGSFDNNWDKNETSTVVFGKFMYSGNGSSLVKISHDNFDKFIIQFKKFFDWRFSNLEKMNFTSLKNQFIKAAVIFETERLKYEKGGNLKKGAEIDDLDNVVQVSDEVLDAPNIIPEQATLFAEGGELESLNSFPTDSEELKKALLFVMQKLEGNKDLLSNIQLNYFETIVAENPKKELKAYYEAIQVIPENKREYFEHTFSDSKYNQLNIVEKLDDNPYNYLPEVLLPKSKVKKVDFSPTPDSVNLGKITDLFVNRDPLRPIMSGVYFNLEDERIEATNAHILLFIKEKPHVSKSCICLMGKTKEWYLKRAGEHGPKENQDGCWEIDGNYMRTSAVVPNEFEFIVTVDAQKLLDYVKASQYFIKYMPIRISFATEDGIQTRLINASYLENSLKAMLMLGYEEVDFCMMLAKNRAIAIVPKGNSRKISYAGINTDLVLTMPFIDEGTKENDFVFDVDNNKATLYYKTKLVKTEPDFPEEKEEEIEVKELPKEPRFKVGDIVHFYKEVPKNGKDGIINFERKDIITEVVKNAYGDIKYRSKEIDGNRIAEQYEQWLVLAENQLPDVGKEIVSEPQNSNEEIESTIEAINLILPSLRGKEKTEAKDTILALKLLLETSTFEKGGPILLAPNGKPSNLDAEMYSLVRTPQFKAWFGDWENDPENASKVVDENGEPVIVYHGSSKDFTEFDNKKSRFSGGIYFSSSKEFAQKFAGNNGIVKAFFLNIKNPVYNGFDGAGVGAEMSFEYRDGGIFTKRQTDKYAKKGTKEYIVGSPNQIKLADGTNTTFDSNTNDIRYAKGGVINKEYNLEFKPIETPLN